MAKTIGAMKASKGTPSAVAMGVWETPEARKLRADTDLMSYANN